MQYALFRSLSLFTVVFDVSYNSMTGSIPTALDQWTAIGMFLMMENLGELAVLDVEYLNGWSEIIDPPEFNRASSRSEMNQPSIGTLQIPDDFSVIDDGDV